MRNPICLFFTGFNTITYWIKSGDYKAIISGCAYATSETKTPKNIHLIECTRCGKSSVGWSWEDLTDKK